MDQFQTQLASGLGAAWHSIAVLLPKALVFLAILVAGYFVAKVVARAFDAVLERVGFDRLVERGGVKRALARTQYDASSLLSKLLFYTMFLFVLQLAFGVFGPNPVSDLLTRVIAFLPSIVVAALIVVVAAAIAKGVRDILGSTMAGLSYGRSLANIASGAIIVVGVFAALSQVGIAPAIVNALFYTMLAIVAGSAIVAIGGSGIAPLRGEWERALGRLHDEIPRLRDQVEQSRIGAGERALEHRPGATPPVTKPARH
jgi:MFS family permease